MASAARKRHRALEEGTPAAARVLDVRETRLRGSRSNRPLADVRVAVAVGGHAPYETEVRMFAWGLNPGGVYPGAVLGCRVHPADHRIVVLDAPGQETDPGGSVLESIFDALLFWV